MAETLNKILAERRAAQGQPGEERRSRMEAKSKVFLTAKQVRGRYGDCSDMSLWRWGNDPILEFPLPMRIKGRRLWALLLFHR